MQHYIALFEEAGFTEVQAEERKLEGGSSDLLERLGLDTASFSAEAQVPPVLAVRGLKPHA